MVESSNTAASDSRSATLVRVARIAALILLVWVAAGVRRIQSGDFGVLSGPLFAGSSRKVSSRWVVAPPGLLRLDVYPRQGVELSLPQAEEAMLPASDGSRFGFRGWITIRPREESWEALHASAAGNGLRGVLLEAMREAVSGLRQGSELEPVSPSFVRDLQGRFESALAQRGVDLRRFQLDSVDFLSVSANDPQPAATDTRLLLIGIDGGDWAILDRLFEQGRLPHLEKLAREGVRAKLLSISPMLSPVIWTTVATGVEPSRHGILDFLVEDEQGSRQPVTSAQRLVPTVWELLSRAEVDVGVTAWWATWPADPVRGYLVSDRVAYQLFGFRADADDPQGKTWPPELYESIRPHVVEPESITWDEVRPYLSGERTEREQFDPEERKLIEEFQTLLASGKTYQAIGRDLRERYPSQFEGVYFEGTDTVGHLFMPYRLPALPGVDPRRIASFSEIVDRYYETVDGFIGELLEDREGWTVMVLSDHGFATDTTRPRSSDSRIGHGAAADWHRRFGVLILSGAHVQQGVRLGEASVYDVAPTILSLFGQPVPQKWPGNVLAQALDRSFLDEHPVRYRLDDPSRRDRDSDALIDPAAADLLAKLESLGYVSAGGESTDTLSARNNTGVALLAEGKYAAAEREFRAGLEETPDAPMLTVNLGLALRFQGRVDEALALFERAMDFQTTRRMAGNMMGQILLEDGELVRAESVLREALEREPDASELRNTLGLILEKKGDLDGARAEFETAVQLDPDAALARSNLGNLAKRRGDLAEAESWYERAIEADPYFMGAYNNLALVYQAQGRMDKAIELYGRALGKAPDNAVVLNNLGSLHYATGNNEEARKLWVRSAAADLKYPSPLNNLAGLEINAGRMGEAERLLRRALEIEPGYGDARMNLAIALSAHGLIDEAREQLEFAIQDPRTGADSWRQLGYLELEQGRHERAAQVLERGRALAPRDTGILNGLGQAYYELRDLEKARSLWQRSLELDPDQPQVRQALGPA